MPPSLRLALSELAGSRVRTALLAGAVAIASSLIVAVSCAIHSSTSSLEFRLVQFIGAADARIVHPAAANFDAGLLDAARVWPEVDLAAARLGGALTLAHADQRLDPATGRIRRLSPRAVGVTFAEEQRMRPFDLLDGRLPAAPDEILIDPLTAELLDAKIGDELSVVRFEPHPPLRVVGVYDRQTLGVLQRPRIYVDRDVLGAITDHAGQVSSIYLTLVPGTDIDAFCAKYADRIPQTLSLEAAERVRAGFDQHVDANRIGLTAASVLTLLGAGLIIAIGLTTRLAERERELAILRAVGATRSQLVAAQLAVGLLLGAVGGAIGIPLGLAITKALVTYFAEYVPTGMTIDARGLAFALVGALVAGSCGALYPAFFASRVSPLEAMTVRARPVRAGRVAACAVTGLVLIAIQLALRLLSDDETRFLVYVYAGLPALFLGWFLLAVPLLLAVTRALGPLLGRALGLPAGLVAGGVTATPFRHGFTAGALMVGIAILVAGWASGVAVQQDWIGRIRFADGFAVRITGITPEHRAAIAALPFVESTCPIGYLSARLVDRQVFGLSAAPPNVICVGFNAPEFFAMNAVDWIEGDPATAIPQLAHGDAAIVAQRFLVAKGVGVGDTLTLGVGRKTKEFRIIGVVSSAGLDLTTQLFGIQSQYTDYAMSCVFVDFDTVSRVFGTNDAKMLQINLTDDVTDEEATRRIEEAVPGVLFRSGRWILDTVRSIANAVIAIHTVVAFAALVLASVAVGAVIAASIGTRRFEYGVLRAVGASRGTLLRLVLGETALLAVTGALTGTLLGFHLAFMDASNLRSLAGLPIGVAVPVGPIAIGWVVVILLASLAALLPAVRLVRRSPRDLVASA